MQTWTSAADSMIIVGVPLILRLVTILSAHTSATVAMDTHVIMTLTGATVITFTT